jgi:SAM-dependent methyltransferase
MATAREHYDRLLAPRYTWMFGDFEAKVAEQQALLERLGVAPQGSRRALDLGCGSGFQSVALARMGFRVKAVDGCEALLAELAARRGDLPIETVRGDIRAVADLAGRGIAVAVCMGDTLSHLERRADVNRLLADTFGCLAAGGLLVLTFRDLTVELEGTARFIPVRSTEGAILTCFLEYEPDGVRVHDLLYAHDGSAWSFRASWYRKLRLGAEYVQAALAAAGFALEHVETAQGLVTLVARRAA